MRKYFKVTVISFTFISFSLYLSIAFAGKTNTYLKIKNQTLSAHLKGVPLKEVFDKIEKESGIWFRGNRSLFETRVSLMFTDLSLQDGLRRILAPMSYSLVFDSRKRLTGVIIIDGPVTGPGISKGYSVSARRKTPSQIDKARSPHSPVATPGSEVLSKDTKRPQMSKGPASPGGSVKITDKQMENFQVTKGASPPGGPVQVTDKELKNFKIEKNCPPPGGPVTATPEALDNFKIIKNCPPPGS